MTDMMTRRLARLADTLDALGIDNGPRVYNALRSTDGGNYATLLGTHIHKAELGIARGARNAVQYCAPHLDSRIKGHNGCPFASPGCIGTCIKTTGHNVTALADRARIKRSARWFLDPQRTLQDLDREIDALEKRAAKQDLHPTVRLAGTDDRRYWAMVEGWQDRPTQFYDYTKRPLTPAHLRAFREGWHVTYSLSENARAMRHSQQWAAHGVNTAIVVGGPVGSTTTVAKKVAAALVKRGEFAGRPTIDGDRDDLRWMDPAAGGWVVLSAKGGKTKHDESGFVVRFDPEVLLGTDWSPETALLSTFDRQRFNPSAAAAAAK